MVASDGYDVFGAIRSQSGSGDTEFRFTGDQRDPQLQRNFYYLRTRYYDPEIGRFLGQDPVPGGNLYAYVLNNPANWTDPSGLCHQRLGYDQICRLVHELEDKEGRGMRPTVCTGDAQIFFLAKDLSVAVPHVQGDVYARVEVTVSGRDASVFATVLQVDDRFGSNVTIKHNIGGDILIRPLGRSTQAHLVPRGVVAVDERVLEYRLQPGQYPSKATVELVPRLGQPPIFRTPQRFSIDLQC